jgi:hypothetical protein
MRDELREELIEQISEIAIVGSSIETQPGIDPETDFEDSDDNS